MVRVIIYDLTQAVVRTHEYPQLRCHLCWCPSAWLFQKWSSSSREEKLCAEGSPMTARCWIHDGLKPLQIWHRRGTNKEKQQRWREVIIINK
jgi:hypothetical protein